MSIAYSGTITKSAGLVAAIGKQTKLLNLKGVKRVTVTFDPLAEKAVETRNFLYQLHLPKVVATNPSCLIKTEIVCDRRPGSITFQFLPKVAEIAKLKNVTLKSEHLSTLELLTLTNKFVSANAPKEEEVKILMTKSQKSATKVKRR